MLAKPFKRCMIIALCVIAFLYALISVVVYFYQERLIFYPEKIPAHFQYRFDNPYEEVNLKTNDGETINSIWFKQKDSRGVILYFHGNAGCVGGWGEVYNDFKNFGYDLFMIDYRSYGKSTGSLSQKVLFKDAMLAYKFVRKHYSNNEVIVFGRSLGSGISLNLCTKVNPKQLILETPYLSMKAMADKTIPWLPVSLILKYPIRSDRFIKKVKCPIDIIHGTDDELIPFGQAVKLSALRENVGFYKIDGGHHMDLSLFPEYHEILKEIIK